MNNIINQILQKTKLSSQEAWWLLEHITQQPKPALMTSDRKLTVEESNHLHNALQDLHNNKPLSYIIGFVPFLNTKITVKPPTLIPRPETEEWTSDVISMLRNANCTTPTILDIGTGSGCIAIALAKQFPQATIYAIDIKQSALQLAQHNAQINNISNITFIESNLFQNLPDNLQFDLIVSNPPYIPNNTPLDNQVAQWEDHDALFADNNGLTIIENIAQQTPQFLKKNNLPFQLIIEIDNSHSLQAVNKLKQLDYTTIHLKHDLFNQPRTIWAKFSS